jgi:hypothetical protein
MAFDPYWDWLQIPPDRRPADFYALLGLPPFESDPEGIRQAGIRRTAHVRKFCLGPRGADATRILGELANAFACVADPERKRAYDESLRPGAVDDPQPELAKSAPPVVMRPILVRERRAGETGDEVMPNDAAADRRPQFARRAGASYWSFRWGSRKRSRRQAAVRKTALLVVVGTLLVSAIAVAARQKGVLFGSTDSVASARVTHVTEPKLADSPPELAIPPANDDEALEHRPEQEPESGLAEATPDESEPDVTEPEPEISPESPEPRAQLAPSAPSKDNEAPANAVAQVEPAADADPRPRASRQEAVEKLKRLEEEAEAQQHFDQGIEALAAGEYVDAVNHFSDAIKAARYRYTELTVAAAGRLDDVWRMLDRRSRRSASAREARQVWRDFQDRLLEDVASGSAGKK